jgi:hypothetical protein
LGRRIFSIAPTRENHGPQHITPTVIDNAQASESSESPSRAGPREPRLRQPLGRCPDSSPWRPAGFQWS